MSWQSNAQDITFFGAVSIGTNYSARDLYLYRDAADTLALRRTSNPQAFRAYNTYTDASNYERAFLRWSSNVLEIGCEAAGTGVQRQLSHPLGTVTASTPMLITQTWNNSGATFNGLLLNITDTASATASTLLDLQVGGSGKFTVAKNGDVGNVASISFSYAPGLVSATNINQYGLTLSSTAVIAWRLGSHGTASDLYLQRDAADTLALRRTTSAQALRIYNTYSSATSFERLNLSWSSNELLFGTEKGSGGGTARPLKIQTDGTTRAGVTAAGSVYVGSGAAALATTATDGFLHIPTCAGTPTGVPTAITGTAPLVADSTNNKVYCYLGGSWVALN